MSSRIRLGTRGSQLALAQSNHIANSLRDLGHEVELIIIQTTGDVTAGSLVSFGSDGVFTKRLQHALLENGIDLAVHSLKDLPTDSVDGLKIGAVPKREDPGDALIFPNDADLKIRNISELPDGFRIGTGSVRRKSQLLNLHKNLCIEDIRGNVDTRLEKLDAGQFDAIVLACAGLNRLGLDHRISYRCRPDEMAPAVGQGALGLEIRDDDLKVNEALQSLNDAEAFAAVTAERKMLNTMCAGCLAPVGAISTTVDKHLTLTGIVLSTDGIQKLTVSATETFENSVELGQQVANQLIADGASELIDASR